MRFLQQLSVDAEDAEDAANDDVDEGYDGVDVLDNKFHFQASVFPTYLFC